MVQGSASGHGLSDSGLDVFELVRVSCKQCSQVLEAVYIFERGAVALDAGASRLLLLYFVVFYDFVSD